MKKPVAFILIITASLLTITSMKDVEIVKTTTQAEDFEIVMPWGLDHDRGKIIKSMVDNSSIAGLYNFVYTIVGGGPSDRDALTARFLAGDYPNMLIVTQDWYTEFSEFRIWHDFAPQIQGWSGDRAGWQADIPAGWWSILDKVNGDGSGSGIYALPMFGLSVLPYLNTDHFEDAGMNATELAADWTMDEFMSAAENLSAAGYTPFAMVGKLQSDIAYMNYMMGSTDDYINSSYDPASVLAWGSSNEYGTNGSLSVNGFARYMKLKGEGFVQSTVDTDGGGEVNAIFTAGNASMVFCGPWGTQLLEVGSQNFTAASMPRNENGQRSTIRGGGISLVPIIGDNSNLTTRAAAVTLAQDLLEDEPQMKTVRNWLGVTWRVPVRTSVTLDPWFTEFPNRTNFIYHVESQDYAYAWGKQHPKWIDIHESVMMPGYRDSLLDVDYNGTYTDQDYTDMAQAALDVMAGTIQTFYLGWSPSPPGFAPEAELIFPTGGEILNGSEGSTSIVWEMNDIDGDILSVEIKYSSDGGSSWVPLINLIDVTFYSWNFSSLSEGLEYRILISVTDGENTVIDESGNFEIIQPENTPPEVKLIFPTGGEILKSSEGPTTIVWEMNDTNGEILSVEIEYSFDGGSSWIPLINLIDVTSYSWDFSSLNEGSAYRILISVTDDENTVIDVSGNFVIIQDANQTTVTSESSTSEVYTGETTTPSITSFPFQVILIALIILPISWRKKTG